MEPYGFFNGETYYGQEEFNEYFNRIYESGVAADDSGALTLKVSAADGAVNVGAGYAIVRGFYYYQESAGMLPITSPAANNRIDRIVVRVNRLTGPVTLEVKQGTESASPKPPALTRNDTIWEISLARVTITPAGKATVVDERADTSVCGPIRPKTFPGYTEMVQQMQESFDRFVEGLAGAVQRNIYVQADTPEGAVIGSIWYQTE